MATKPNGWWVTASGVVTIYWLTMMTSPPRWPIMGTEGLGGLDRTRMTGNSKTGSSKTNRQKPRPVRGLRLPEVPEVVGKPVPPSPAPPPAEHRPTGTELTEDELQEIIKAAYN